MFSDIAGADESVLGHIGEWIGLSPETWKPTDDLPWSIALSGGDSGNAIHRTAKTRIEVIAEKRLEQRGEAESEPLANIEKLTVLVVPEMMVKLSQVDRQRDRDYRHYFTRTAIAVVIAVIGGGSAHRTYARLDCWDWYQAGEKWLE